jgi:hypothetical protein
MALARRKLPQVSRHQGVSHGRHGDLDEHGIAGVGQVDR